MLFKFGYRISKVNNSGELVKIHKYKDYNEYRETQIFYNKKKIDKVWADEITLEKISDFLKDRIKTSIIKGICHGSRNGFEQNFFNEKKDGFEVIGTDISDTAKDYKNSVIHDFHNEKKEWINNVTKIAEAIQFDINRTVQNPNFYNSETNSKMNRLMDKFSEDYTIILVTLKKYFE